MESRQSIDTEKTALLKDTADLTTEYTEPGPKKMHFLRVTAEEDLKILQAKISMPQPPLFYRCTEDNCFYHGYANLPIFKQYLENCEPHLNYDAIQENKRLFTFSLDEVARAYQENYFVDVEDVDSFQETSPISPPEDTTSKQNAVPEVKHADSPKKLSCDLGTTPGTLFTQRYSFPLEEDAPTEAPTHPVDEHQSRVTALKTTTLKDANNLQPTIIIGYTSAGLPFIINAEALPPDENEAESLCTLEKYIMQHIAPLMDEYAEKLSKAKNSDLIISELLSKIMDDRYRSNQYHARFNLSLGITYEDEAEGFLHCAGFGVGKTGLILQQKNENPRPLVYTQTELKGSTPCISTKMSLLEGTAVLEAGSMFHTIVEPGDELFSYTSLPEKLLFGDKINNLNLHNRRHPKAKGQQASVHKRSLKGSIVPKVGVTLHQTIERLKSTHGEADRLLGSVIIPNPEQQKNLQLISYQRELDRLKDAAKNKAGKVKEKIEAVISVAEQLTKEDTSKLTLTSYLAACNRTLLDNTSENIKALLARAKIGMGKPGPLMRKLGYALMGLGLGLMAAGSVFVVGGTTALRTGASAPHGATAIAGGVALGLGGLSLFALGCWLNTNRPPNTVNGRQEAEIARSTKKLAKQIKPKLKQ